jgi:hypothetical protein
MKKTLTVLLTFAAINLYASTSVENPTLDIDGQYSDSKTTELSNEELIEQARGEAERRNVVEVSAKIRNQKLNTKQSKKIQKKELQGLGTRMESMFGED